MSNYLSQDFRAVTREGQALAKKTNNPRNKAIYSCLGLAMEIAFKYKDKTTMHIDDLIQFSNMGLVYAYENFDESKGVAFSTYAYNWCRKYVLHAIDIVNNQMGSTRRESNESMHNSLFISRDSWVEHDSGEEMSQNPFDEYFIDEYSDHDDRSDIPAQKAYQFNVINGILDELSERERRVTCAYFGLPPFETASNIKEVSNKFRINKSVIESVLESSIEKMKKYVIENNLPIELIFSSSSIISKYKDDVKEMDYVTTERIFKHQLTTELKKIGDASGISERDLLTAIYMDEAQNYNFFSHRKIMGHDVYKKFTIEKRYKKHGGTAKFNVSYSVFKDGKCIVKDRKVNNILGVKIKEIQNFFESHKINQMHCPFTDINRVQLQTA